MAKSPLVYDRQPTFIHKLEKKTLICAVMRETEEEMAERERERGGGGLIAMRERDCGDSQCQENFEMELLRDY